MHTADVLNRWNELNARRLTEASQIWNLQFEELLAHLPIAFEGPGLVRNLTAMLGEWMRDPVNSQSKPSTVLIVRAIQAFIAQAGGLGKFKHSGGRDPIGQAVASGRMQLAKGLLDAGLGFFDESKSSKYLKAGLSRIDDDDSAEVSALLFIVDSVDGFHSDALMLQALREDGRVNVANELTATLLRKAAEKSLMASQDKEIVEFVHVSRAL